MQQPVSPGDRQSDSFQNSTGLDLQEDNSEAQTRPTFPGQIPPVAIFLPA